jgi:hypothetical protein
MCCLGDTLEGIKSCLEARETVGAPIEESQYPGVNIY